MEFTDEGWWFSGVQVLENFPDSQMKCLTLPLSVPALRLVCRFRASQVYIFRERWQMSHD